MSLFATLRLDLARWRRARTMLAMALTPPVAMGLFVWVLALSVGRQPVALVVEEHGPQGALMAHILAADTDAYALKQVSLARAEVMLGSEQVAAVIVIPPAFDAAVAKGTAVVDLTLNNVDIDFSDDIRRAVDRSVAQFDAPFLGFGGERLQAGLQGVLPNAYRVAIAEVPLRKTNVGFLAYELAPVMLFVVLSVGTLGVGWLTAADFSSGTWRLLRASPATSLGVATGRVGAAMAVVGLADAPLVVVAGVTERLSLERLAVLCAIVLSTAGVGVGLGLAVSLAFRRPRFVAMASTALCSYLFLLGGGFTTIAFLPPWLQDLSSVVPTRYAIDGLRQTMFYAQPQHVGSDLAVLLIVAFLSVVAAASVMRRAS